MSYKFAIVGGDLRNIKLAGLLKSSGHQVFSYGMANGLINSAVASTEVIEKCNDLAEACGKGEIVISSIPFTSDGKTVNAPFHNSNIDIYDFLNTIPEGRMLIAGKIPIEVKNFAEVKGIKVFDILEREDMSILNAIPTAEGAIQIAMEEMPITIHNCNALVLGYGRIGKMLIGLLKSMGAKTAVAVRKNKDFAWAEYENVESMDFTHLSNKIGKFDLIINTVPALVLEKHSLEYVKHGALIIDLASNPGGVDFQHANKLLIKTIHALSLPGKVAPTTSAISMGKVIFNIIEEAGYNV